VNVIQFKRRAGYAVYSFIENDGRTVLERWFEESEVPEFVWAAFYGLWTIYEAGGPLSIQGSVIDVGNGFFGLVIPLRGTVTPCPIFRFGPFDEETEITFLSGAQWDDKRKRVRPFSAVGIAEENLELLLERRHRRRREQGT
jgi:hypothetical protein